MLLFVAALTVALAASAVWCVGAIASDAKRTSRSGGRAGAAALLPLGAVIALAIGLRVIFVPPHHAMYLDEPWYAEAACRLTRGEGFALCEATWTGDTCVPYAKAPGWPVLLAAWTVLFGCHSAIGIAVNRIIGSATVVLVALTAGVAGARWWQAIAAAMILAIHPVHVSWSATGETNIAASATLLAGACAALMHLRSARWCAAIAAISAFGLATAIRPECLLAALTAAAVVELRSANAARRLIVAGAIVAVSGAAAAAALPLWAMNEAISGGRFLAARNVLDNARAVARPASISIHGVVLLLAAIGAARLVRSGHRSTAWLLGGAALATLIAVLAYERFDERMLLAATVCALPLSAFAFAPPGPPADGTARSRLRAPTIALAVLGLLALLWRNPLSTAASPPETQLLETRIADQVARRSYGADALLIAEQPTVLGAGGATAVMSTAHALADGDELMRRVEGGQPVYFLCDMYCEPGFGGVGVHTVCGDALAKWALTPVVKETLNSRVYVLYRVTGAGGGSTPRCPRAP